MLNILCDAERAMQEAVWLVGSLATMITAKMMFQHYIMLRLPQIKSCKQKQLNYGTRGLNNGCCKIYRRAKQDVRGARMDGDN